MRDREVRAGGFCFGDLLGTLNPKQAVFVAAYIGVAKKNATEAARIAGYKQPGMHGSRLMKNDEIIATIAEHLTEIKSRGIADAQNRVDELVERHTSLKQIVSDRAAHPFYADVPGGRTGYVLKKLKNVTLTFEKDPDDPNSKARQVRVEQWEVEDNVALLRELREHEKQAAQELGQWSEKSETAITGKDGGPIEFAGIDVPLPARPDDSAS